MENVTVMRDPGRYPEYYFSILKRDQFQSLAGAEIVGRDTVRIRLPQLIVSDFLFQPWSNGHQRGDPVRLLALDFSDPRKPVYKVVDDVGSKVRTAWSRRRENGSEYDCGTDRSRQDG